jgi:hypothetical protein
MNADDGSRHRWERTAARLAFILINDNENNVSKI